MASNVDKSKVLVRAPILDGQTGKLGPERNIRNVRVIYVAEVLDHPELRMFLFEGEVWDYKRLLWQNVYGEMALQMNKGQTFDPNAPIHIMTSQLSSIEWFTNNRSGQYQIIEGSI